MGGEMIAVVDDSDELMLTNMTQEIGFIDSKDVDSEIDFSKYPVGSILTLVPYHACATAACYQQYYLHDDQGIITQIWTPCKDITNFSQRKIASKSDQPKNIPINPPILLRRQEIV